jgi:hypothetical protein
MIYEIIFSYLVISGAVLVIASTIKFMKWLDRILT